MPIPRIIGILVFMGVPAIIGGGIVYHFMESYPAVFAYVFMLLMGAGAFVHR